MHAWDRVTPVEEVTSTFNDLVREGKIRHYGFSDTPAWYLTRAQTLAQKEGKEPLIALQLEYSLVERNIECEHIQAARELGMGICPWSPMASSFLSVKYMREGGGGQGDGRLEKTKDNGNPVFQKFTERNWKVLEVLRDVSRQLGKSPSQVALNWVATQPGITSTLIGATKIDQLKDNIDALQFALPCGYETPSGRSECSRSGTSIQLLRRNNRGHGDRRNIDSGMETGRSYECGSNGSVRAVG